MTSLLIVVGMNREARIVGGRGRVLVGTAGISSALNGDVGGLISFGLCGGLDPGLRAGDLLIGRAVIADGVRFEADGAWAGRLKSALPDAVLADFAGVGAIAGSAAQKAALRAATGASAVDMESHEAARAAARAQIPFAILRAVSDGADQSLPRAAQAGFRADGRVDIAAVIAAVAARPRELPALLRTAGDASLAFRSLERAAIALMA